MRKPPIKSDSTIKPELPKPELPRKALLHAETPATKDAVRVPIEAETLPMINPTVLNVSEREETCGPPAHVGFRWPNSTRAVVFGQGRAFHWKDFCNLSFLPGRRGPGSLSPKGEAGHTTFIHSRGFNVGSNIVRLEESVKVSNFSRSRKCLTHARLTHAWLTYARTFFSFLALACLAALSVRAQNGRFSPYQGESDGVSAGGKWMEFHSEDKMTGTKKVRFELLSNNYLSEDPDYKPRIQFMCSNGKYAFTDFNPGIRLGPPNRPGFWGQPQMEVMVRVDDKHSNHAWNWIRDRFLSVDKGTTRDLIGAHIFNVEIRGRNGPEIAEFSPAGLDLGHIKQACHLTPRKPGKD
jgi:hypothetical protein